MKILDILSDAFTSRTFLWVITILNFAFAGHWIRLGFEVDPVWFGFAMLNAGSGFYTLYVLIKYWKD